VLYNITTYLLTYLHLKCVTTVPCEILMSEN